MVILPNGDVTPCMGVPQLIMGNVRQMSPAEIWKTSSVRQSVQNIRWADNEACLDCRFLDDCRRCPASAALAHGDIRKPAPMDCHIAAAIHNARMKIEADEE